MDPASILRALSPPVCAACRSRCGSGALLCPECIHELNGETPLWGSPPPGVQQAVSSFRHEGVARELLHAFKFGRMPGLASIMAGFMAENLDDGLAAATVVAVPAAALRQRLRGFDPAALLSRRLCELAGLPPPASGVIKRTGRGRQRGRGREERMAAPPAIEPVSGIDGPILLVDDVITTGATISICAATLKRCGAGPVTALSFTRRV